MIITFFGFGLISASDSSSELEDEEDGEDAESEVPDDESAPPDLLPPSDS